MACCTLWVLPVAERLNIGDKVRVKVEAIRDYLEAKYAGQEVTVIDSEDLDYSGVLTYYVEASDGLKMWAFDGNLDIAGALAARDSTITLNQEQAFAIREALTAIGWDRDDLGPLAYAQQPTHSFTVTVPIRVTAEPIADALLAAYGVEAVVKPVN